MGLTFEALRLNPRGVDVALVFTGFYCLLIGYLMFRSTFVPRILGALMAFAGLGWLTYLSNPLVSYLSPYNLACALLAEAIRVPVAPRDGCESKALGELVERSPADVRFARDGPSQGLSGV